MKDKLIIKLKKRMETSSKAITTSDKAIETIKELQVKVIEDFNANIRAIVKKSQEEIEYHKDIIEKAEGMTL